MPISDKKARLYYKSAKFNTGIDVTIHINLTLEQNKDRLKSIPKAKHHISNTLKNGDIRLYDNKNKLVGDKNLRDVDTVEMDIISDSTFNGWINAVDELKTLKNVCNEVLLRNLIENGRKKVWEQYKDDYISNYSDKVEQYPDRDDNNKVIMRYRPKKWEDFINIYVNSNNLFKLLKGGVGSEYAILSEDIHTHENEKHMANIILHHSKRDAFKELFEFVYNNPIELYL